ncbi:hypothetical protein JXA32_07130 [Candidatus Sumerlaeota bacterium]|nr:hypothetical protein [Candidatus Sumerlaeota bacterium]
MSPGIAVKPAALAAQCTTAAAGIASEEAYPVTAPSAAALQSHADAINERHATINNLETQLRAERQTLKQNVDAARGDMTKVDQATGLLCGPEGAQKQNFGFTPKKSTKTPTGPWSDPATRVANI